MDIRFTGSARDFRDAVWANNWARPLGVAKLVFFLFLLPIASWALFALGIWSEVSTTREFGLRTIGPQWPLLLGMLFPLYWRWNLNRCFKRQVNNRENILVISDDGIFCEHKGFAKSEINWAAITETVEGSKVFLLKLAKLRYIYVPKRVLTSEQQAELRILIAAHVPAK